MLVLPNIHLIIDAGFWKVILPWNDLDKSHEQYNACVKAEDGTTIYDESTRVQQTLYSVK